MPKNIYRYAENALGELLERHKDNLFDALGFVENEIGDHNDDYSFQFKLPKNYILILLPMPSIKKICVGIFKDCKSERIYEPVEINNRVSKKLREEYDSKIKQVIEKTKEYSEALETYDKSKAEIGKRMRMLEVWGYHDLNT